MIEDHFGMFLVLIPHCMTEILARECKSGKSTILAFGTVVVQTGGFFYILEGEFRAFLASGSDPTVAG